jgi:hypothetical protein
MASRLALLLWRVCCDGARQGGTGSQLAQVHGNRHPVENLRRARAAAMLFGNARHVVTTGDKYRAGRGRNDGLPRANSSLANYHKLIAARHR